MTISELKKLLRERSEDDSDLASITVGALIEILKACGLLEECDRDLVHSNHGTHRIIRNQEE